jgi:hypothetical protein
MNRLRVYLWIGPALFIMLTLAEWKTLGAGLALLLLLPVNLLFIYAVGAVLLRSIDVGARGWVGMVSGAGNIAPAPSFSGQESLIIRGQFAEARDSFLAHLEQHPGDHDARLALAHLYRSHLAEFDAAERLYFEVRQGKPTPRQEASAHNQLIDHYRRTGQRGRLMVELARFAERYASTRAGAEAKRTLEEMKQGLAADANAASRKPDSPA